MCLLYKRSKGTALRSPFIYGHHQSLCEDPGSQASPQQADDPLVPNPLLYLAHQLVMVDPIEEFLQVNIHHPVIPLTEILLGFGHGLMGRASRTKPVTVLRKRWVPARLQHPEDRLLDEAVHHCRYPQLSDAAFWLRDFNPPDRLRVVLAGEQLFSDLRPVRFEIGG